MPALISYSTGLDALADYVLRVAEQRPGLLREAVAAGSLGPLVAQALLEMSADVHPPGERASPRPPKISDDKAQQYLAEAGGNVTVAAQRAKVSRATLYRVLGLGGKRKEAYEFAGVEDF